MERMAIIGAGGFVGTRLLESCLLKGYADVRPVIRSPRNQARLCRFGLADRAILADAEDIPSISAAIDGCPVVVNLVSSDPLGIVRSTKAIHAACNRVGVRRLIHLSSAVVYDRVESPEIDDETPAFKHHWMPYAKAKAAAEHYLARVIASSRFEITVLRPGIVWGPRSGWSINAARALASKKAYLVGDGTGVCNSIYIDNLVACILAACELSTVADGFFNVSDDEYVTWRDFYSSLAPYLGFDMAGIRSVSADRFHHSPASLLLALKESALYCDVKKRITPENRSLIKNKLSRLLGFFERPSDDEQPAAAIQVTREMWHLQTTRYKLSNRKFADRFGHVPPVTFLSGMEMTASWLAYAGYLPGVPSEAP